MICQNVETNHKCEGDVVEAGPYRFYGIMVRLQLCVESKAWADRMYKMSRHVSNYGK